MSKVQQRAILFADLVGSTALYEQLGNNAAKAAVDACLGDLGGIVAQQGGGVVKTIGDEVMASFAAADAAATAAIAMQTAMRDGGRFDVRIGFHCGEVIADDGDLFGDAVNIAARLAQMARGGQILTSEQTALRLAPDTARVRAFDFERFKGKSQAIRVFEIVWEAEDSVTRITGRFAGSASAGVVQAQRRLQLSVGERQRVFTPEQLPATAGRDTSCDVLVVSDFASRVHAHFEFTRGKFVLADHSTNGTFVSATQTGEVFLRRESMPLLGRGFISLGCPKNEQTGELIEWIGE